MEPETIRDAGRIELRPVSGGKEQDVQQRHERKLQRNHPDEMATQARRPSCRGICVTIDTGTPCIGCQFSAHSDAVALNWIDGNCFPSGAPRHEERSRVFAGSYLAAGIDRACLAGKMIGGSDRPA